MRRTLEEIYCKGVRRAGSHGSWEPGSWVWPGTFGSFRRGVFRPEKALDPQEWGYRVVPNAPSLENVRSSGVRMVDVGGGASVPDPLAGLASAGGKLVYSVAKANEVLVLTKRGRWWEVEDRGELLARIRAHIESLPLNWAMVCSAYETGGGVAGVSSRSTGGFEIGLDATGAPVIAATPSVKAGGRLRFTGAAYRESSFGPEISAEEPGPAVPPEVRRRSMYTPFFSKGFRVSKKLYKSFGRPELLSFEGYPVSGPALPLDPLDRVYDPNRAELPLDEIKQMPIEDLFEEVTPEILDEEVNAEVALELHHEDVAEDLTLASLAEVGVESVRWVSVARGDPPRLAELRAFGAEEDEEEEEERETTSA